MKCEYDEDIQSTHTVAYKDHWPTNQTKYKKAIKIHIKLNGKNIYTKPIKYDATKI